MASPPSSLNLQIPRKRSSISSLPSASSAKRRKPSNLRNAFSPDAESVGSPRFSRSPSLDSVATGSVANGTGGKKRKRKGDAGDTGSVAGSSVRGGKGADGRSAVGGEGDADQDEYDEDDGDGGEEVDMTMEAGSMTVQARRDQEKAHERLLMEFMTTAQQDRYVNYRRIKLKRETVRKLANQTLSQSVPQTIVVAIGIYAKTFLGELIDRALTVRDEWQAVKTHRPNENLSQPILNASLHRPSAHIKDPRNKPTNGDISNAGMYLNQVDRSEPLWKEINKDTTLRERLKGTDMGPLTPAHIREALRRYKRDRDGGGAGFAGMSLEGVERTMGRTGGRRLFK